MKALEERLLAKLHKIANKHLKLKTAETVTVLSSVAGMWMANLKAVLSIPAASRGYTNATSGMLKPNRTDNPMMVTGDLMRSLFTRVVPIVATDNATISIFHGFSTISSKKDGSDYGDTLNENHRSIRGFKERAADKLRIAIATTLGVI